MNPRVHYKQSLKNRLYILKSLPDNSEQETANWKNRWSSSLLSSATDESKLATTISSLTIGYWGVHSPLTRDSRAAQEKNFKDEQQGTRTLLYTAFLNSQTPRFPTELTQHFCHSHHAHSLFAFLLNTGYKKNARDHAKYNNKKLKSIMVCKIQRKVDSIIIRNHLALSNSSMIASSFCRERLLILDPTPTVTKIWSCLGVYS